MPDEPTIEDVKAAIARLPREDRANLRPWLLARYDVRGYQARGYVGAAQRDAALGRDDVAPEER